MTNEVKHLFRCLLAIHTAFLKRLFKTFAHLFSLDNFSSYWAVRVISWIKFSGI